jgi:hypothetical protein
MGSRRLQPAQGRHQAQRADHAQVLERQAAEGVTETEASIRNKLSRGTFSAVFLLQCLKAIGIETLRMD